VVSDHSDQFVPKSASKDFPQPLQLLKDMKYVQIEYHNLLKECESVSIDVTKKMAKMWKMLQGIKLNPNCGTNTEQAESRMKAVCHTDPAL